MYNEWFLVCVHWYTGIQSCMIVVYILYLAIIILTVAAIL